MKKGVVKRFWGLPQDGPYFANGGRQHPSIIDAEWMTDRKLAKIDVYRIKRDRYPKFNPLSHRVELVPIKVGSKEAIEKWKLIKLKKTETKDMVRQKRRSEYVENLGPEGDQLDVILKQFNHLRFSGTEMIQEMDNLLSKWLSVKADNPLP
tara:strand:- start:357 stop:809 length:453 start_codon:yes stop_codon:yes gene_type:complete